MGRETKGSTFVLQRNSMHHAYRTWSLLGCQRLLHKMNIFYFFKEAFRGFFQAKLMTFVSVITIGLTLFFLGCVLVGYLNIKLWLKNAANRVEAVVYVDDAASADSLSLAGCVAQVKECPQIATAVVVDKKEAWNRFKAL